MLKQHEGGTYEVYESREWNSREDAWARSPRKNKLEGKRGKHWERWQKEWLSTGIEVGRLATWQLIGAQGKQVIFKSSPSKTQIAKRTVWYTSSLSKNGVRSFWFFGLTMTFHIQGFSGVGTLCKYLGGMHVCLYCIHVSNIFGNR